MVAFRFPVIYSKYNIFPFICGLCVSLWVEHCACGETHTHTHSTVSTGIYEKTGVMWMWKMRRRRRRQPIHSTGIVSFGIIGSHACLFSLMLSENWARCQGNTNVGECLPESFNFANTMYLTEMCVDINSWMDAEWKEMFLANEHTFDKSDNIVCDRMANWFYRQ